MRKNEKVKRSPALVTSLSILTNKSRSKKSSTNLVKKVKALVKAGKVSWKPQVNQEVLENMALPGSGKKTDFTVTKAYLQHGSFTIGWETVSAGFGEFSMWNKDGEVNFDNEGMSKRFLKETLAKLIDNLPIK